MKTYDAVVVGSGFGGAVVACRLSERGRSVLVLERGRRWGREDFPRPGRPGAPWWYREGEPGLFEVRCFPGMKVIVAAGVGGGSLVYTNVQKIPPPSAFAGWPAPISLEQLRPCYERVQAMLEPSPLPQELTRLRAFQAAHAAAGRGEGVERPPLAVRWPARQSPEGPGGSDADDECLNRFGASQKSCNLCGQCVFGCDRHAKNTLDLTYLKQAESRGAEVWPLCRVTRIEPRPGGYEIKFRRQAGNEAEREGEDAASARSLFLAGGSLGTTELLLRCRDRARTLPHLSPRLGQAWSANGDFFAGLLGSRIPIQPTVGPSVAVAYQAGEGEGFYTLDGSIPPVVVGRGRRVLRLLDPFLQLKRGLGPPLPLPPAATPNWACGAEETEEWLRHAGAFFLMGRDAGDGRLRLDPNGALDLDWDPRVSEPLLGRMRRYLGELGRGYGGWMLVPEAWWGTGMGTVHPLGGCGMGRDASEGVCDPFGRVFGYPNLYVCDASIFPRALGFPPSMTIAALAEHIAEHALDV